MIVTSKACDRCGADCGVEEAVSFQITSWRIEEPLLPQYMIVDLCEDCAKEFVKFMRREQ